MTVRTPNRWNFRRALPTSSSLLDQRILHRWHLNWAQMWRTETHPRPARKFDRKGQFGGKITSRRALALALTAKIFSVGNLTGGKADQLGFWKRRAMAFQDGNMENMGRFWFWQHRPTGFVVAQFWLWKGAVAWEDRRHSSQRLPCKLSHLEVFEASFSFTDTVPEFEGHTRWGSQNQFRPKTWDCKGFKNIQRCDTEGFWRILTSWFHALSDTILALKKHRNSTMLSRFFVWSSLFGMSVADVLDVFWMCCCLNIVNLKNGISEMFCVKCSFKTS